MKAKMSRKDFNSLQEQLNIDKIVYEYEDIDLIYFKLIVNLMSDGKLILSFDQIIDVEKGLSWYISKTGFNIEKIYFLECVRETRILRKELSEAFFHNLKIAKP